MADVVVLETKHPKAVQVLAERILAVLGATIPAGQMVIHFADGGKVKKIETNVVHSA